MKNLLIKATLVVILGVNILTPMTYAVSQANSTTVKDLHLYFVDGSTTKHYTIMDRNMGASDINTGGYYYQWGNNYGFTHPLTSTGSDQVPYDTWHPYEAEPSTYSSSTFVKHTSNWQGPNTSADQPLKHNSNLWGGKDDTILGNGSGTKQQRQGPCITGYYVPSAYDAYTLIKAWIHTSPLLDGIDDNIPANTKAFYDEFATDLLLVIDGNIDRKTGNLGSPQGGVWTSSPVLGPDHNNRNQDYSQTGTKANNARIMWFKSSQFGSYSTIGNANKSDGYHVRCFKNDFEPEGTTPPLNIHLEPGQKTVIAVDGSGVIQTLNDPSGSGFKGWYTTENFLKGTKVEKGNTLDSSVKNLYARWDGDEESFVVTFKNYDDTVLQTGAVASGSVLSGGYYTGAEPTKPFTAQTGYYFTGWTPDFATITGETTYTAKFEERVNKYTVTFVDEDGTTVLKQATEYDYGTASGDIVKPADPTKAATAQYTYTFAGWTPELAEVTGNVTYKANFKEIKIGNGGRGFILKKDKCPNGDYSDSYYDGKCETVLSSGVNVNESEGFSQEFLDAYNRAYKNGITTMPTIKEANMDGYIIRSHLAKMMSQFAINVVGAKPNIGKEGCDKFNDIANETDELKGYMKTACELGLMGLHADGKTVKDNFDPNDYVTRAEFGTVLSRFLYLDENNLTAQEIQEGAEWYSKHLSALKLNGIMTQIDGQRITSKELRGYVMLMLMRSAQK